MKGLVNSGFNYHILVGRKYQINAREDSAKIRVGPLIIYCMVIASILAPSFCYVCTSFLILH